MHVWLFILIAYLPFQIALNPFTGVDLASIRVFILAFFGLWLLAGFWRKHPIKVKWNLAAFCLLGFLLIGSISILVAANHLWALRKFLFFGSIFPLYFLVVALASSWSRVKKIVWLLFLGSGLIALIGLFQFLSQFIVGFDPVFRFWALNIIPVFSGFNYGSMILSYPSWIVDAGHAVWMRAFSIFSDSHMLAFYLGLILPLGVALYFISSKHKKIIFIINALLFFVLLLTFTRGAYLSLLASFLVMAGLLWKYFKAKLAAVFILLCLLILIVPGTPFSFRFATIFNLQEESNVGRLAMWQRASQIGQQHFFSGVGLGNYSLMVNPEMDYRNPTTAHNLYLDIFSEMGIFALIIWLLLILGSIGIVYRKIIKADRTSDQAWLALGLMGSLVYYASHSVFETAIYHPVILPLLMIILGLAYANFKEKPLA